MGVAVHLTVGSDEGERTPFNGRCGVCGHVWPVCYLPMRLDLAAKVIKSARCPMCGDGKVFMA